MTKEELNQNQMNALSALANVVLKQVELESSLANLESRKKHIVEDLMAISNELNAMNEKEKASADKSKNV